MKEMKTPPGPTALRGGQAIQCKAHQGAAYWIGNQAIVQRALGARSEFEAKASYVWGAVLKNFIPLLIAVPGLIAAARYPELADGDQAIPHLVAVLLRAGLRGLFLLRLPCAVTSPPGGEERWDANLKVWAAVALLLQVVLYCLL